MFKNTIKRLIAPAVMELIEECPVTVNLEKLIEKIEIVAPMNEAEKRAAHDDVTDALALALDFARHRSRVTHQTQHSFVEHKITTRRGAVAAALKLLWLTVRWHKLNLHLAGHISGRTKTHLQPPVESPENNE